MYVCVCEGGEGRLECGFILLYSIFNILYFIFCILCSTRYMLSPICYIVISLFYILCTTLRVIERVETELLKVNEGVDPELL